MASSIETTSTTTTLKNNGNTYATVDTNDDVTITNDLAVSGNVGIGTTAPLAKNHTFGAGTAVVVSGSDGRAEAIIEGANIPLTSSYGNLNIISNTSQAADTGGQIAFGGKHTDSNNAYGTWAVIKGAKENATSANIASYLAFSTRANGGGNTEKLRITSAGNVGIGTTAPAAKINVASGDGATAVNQAILSGGRSLGGGAVGGAGALLFTNSYWNANKGAALITGVDSGSSGGELTLSTTANGGGQSGVPVERMRIKQDGNVGIGTTAPEAKLDIRSDIDESSTYTGQLAINSVTKSTGNLARIMFSHDNHGSASIASDYESSGNGNLIFSTRGGGNPTERMRIAASGSVGIGTEVPSTGYGGAISNVKLALKGAGAGGNNGTATLLVGGDNNHYSSITSEHIGGGLTYLSFGTSPNAGNPTEKMRISSDGYVGFGINNPTVRIHLAGGTAGNSNSGIAAAWNVHSDYRLKENIVPLEDATSKVKRLKPVRFNWKDEDGTPAVDGFLAHEVSPVVPEAVLGEKDAVDEEGAPIMQGLDQAKLVPLLVKTVQEQQTVIESLEARIAKLEGRK